MLTIDIRGILSTYEQVRVALNAATLGEQAVLGHKSCSAIVTAGAVSWVAVALGSMAVPRRRIDKQLPAIASVHWVFIASHLMSIFQCFTI